jgi:sugar diacid utilization regulator
VANEVQALVDSLARRLDRAVAVDDRNFRIIAYSRHVGPIDQVRLDSILAREPSDVAKRHVLSQGVADAIEPFRIPAAPEIEMDARVGAPIRAHDTLIGWVWLVDPDHSLTDDDLKVVQTTATALADVLYRQQLLNELELGRERELLRDLLADDVDLRDHAAAELVDADLFVAKATVAAIAVLPADDVEPRLERARRSLSPRHRLHLVRPDHALLIVATNDPALEGRGIEGLAAQLAEDGGVVVGVGDPQPQLAGAVTSYRQALRAARLAQVVRTFAPVAMWSQLGIYRLLSQIPVEEVLSDAVHPGLARLLENGTGASLVETLETYLDLGCDAKATSAALSLHRASLYYRLNRIEEIVNVNLRDGEERLALHLGLKLARMAGIQKEKDD